jgi:tetratricopeptide (TPR) repeat protein
MTFVDAESWILFEDYNEALELYLDLNRIYPTNSNIKYRIGQCYVNIPGEKEKAIPYLEDAVKNINPKYKEGRFRETRAPYDALYYLANAYRVTNQFDKALETYELFKENLDNKIYDTTIVNLQIQSIYNAKELMQVPLFVREINMGDNINESFSEYNPVVSNDESVIVFTKALSFYNALMYSTRSNGTWSVPINLNEPMKIDVGRDIFPTSISSDGKTLYLYGSENYDGVIFSSTLSNGTWGPLVKLNDNINTKFWESHAAISHDNKKLYFTSNRKGTFGGLDIYVSNRDSSGNWGPAANLGPRINTPYNEETPFLSKDDKNLFFSSRGHFNIGGYDIFYSTLMENGEWSVPLNVGYPLNTPDDDVFFKPINEGYQGYYAKFGDAGYGRQDIYRIELFSDNHPRKFIIRGVVRVADLIGNAKDRVRISAMNIKDPDQVVVVYADPVTGEYELMLPHGEFEIAYESPGGEKVVRNIDLALDNPSDTLALPGTVLPKTDFTADLFIDSHINILVNKGDTVEFPVRIEPGSYLTIEHWVGEKLISTENHLVNDSVFIYKMVPLEGNNRIVFKSTDRFSNTTTAEVFVTREKDRVAQEIPRPEYSRVIAQKQIAALAEMHKNRADASLRKVIAGAAIDKQQFGKVDDFISYLKEEAAKQKISAEEVDMLALKVAVMDNVLTQAAVDLLAKYATGDLKTILDNIDIYELNLKTWSDLQKYVETISGGKFTAEDLNELAEYILSGAYTSIPALKEKIVTYSENSEHGTLIRQSVDKTETKGIKKAGAWLQSVNAESLRRGLTNEQMAEMIALISSMSDTELEQFIRNLIKNSDDPVQTWLNSLDLKKEKITSPKELILYLLNNRDKVPDESLFNSLSKHIVTEDVPVKDIIAQMSVTKRSSYWYLWLLAGAGIILFIIFYYRKQKKEKRKGVS